MNEENHDYHYYMRQARKYQEMADNDDGYRRRVLLGVVRDMEYKAKQLLRQATEPGSKTHKPHS